MSMPGIFFCLTTLSIRHYLYALVTVISLMVLSIVAYMSWQHHLYKEKEYISNHYHLETVLLATRVKEDLHGIEAHYAKHRTRDQATGGHPVDDGYYNQTIYRLQINFAEIMRLYEMFRFVHVEQDSYMPILVKGEGQLERISQGLLAADTMGHSMSSLSAFALSMEQLRRLHSIDHKDMYVLSERQRIQSLRNLSVIAFFMLVLGFPIVRKILAQYRIMVDREQRSETELRQSENRFRSLASSAPVGIFRSRMDGAWIYVNEQCSELIGLSRDACLGQGWKRQLRADYMGAAEASWLHMIDGCHSLSDEYAFIRENGNPVWVICQARPEKDAAGNVIGYIGTLTDVTARIRAENEVRQRKMAMETIFNSLPDIFFRMGKDGTILDYQAKNDSDLYVEPECFIGKRMQDVLPADVGQLFMEHMGLIGGPGETAAFEYELMVNQVTTPYEARLVCLGETDEIIALVRDISDRLRADQQLQQAAIVYENTVEGIFIADGKGIVVSVNRAFTDITGYGADEVLGKGSGILDSGRHDSEFSKSMWSQLDEQSHWQGEIWSRRKGGESFPAWLSINSVPDSSGKLCNYVAIFSDITEMRRSQDELEHLARHDVLTDLPNRLLFESRLEHAIHHAHRSGEFLAVMFLDLDRFKIVNDSLGHAAGDSLLQQVATRLTSVVRKEDTVSRMGGDEFTFLLEDVSSRGAAKIAEKCIHALKQPVEFGDREIYLSGSVGISLFPEDGEDVDTLVRNADAAMYKAKAAGRDNYQFYTNELTVNALEQVSMEAQLRRALERNEFRLVYQPQVEMPSGKLIGVEALLRWESPEYGLVGPDRFIPLLEDSGLIVPVGEWVLETACRQARDWLDMGWTDCNMAVNVAGEQITRSDIVGLVHQILDRTGLPAERLELEMTETFAMSDPENTIGIFQELRDHGIRIAIDDFGTGYSSLAYLKRLPIDRLKIDRSFIRDIPGDVDDEAITQAIIALGQSLRLDVIAEGVETADMVDFLVSHDCHYGQGFFFGKPMAAVAIQELLDLDLEIIRNAASS